MVRWPRLLIALIAATSVAARVVYFFQLDATPFIAMHQWRQTDMHYYDGWARQIAAGDVVSVFVRLPMHRWHHDVAARYFAGHPDAKATLEQAAARAGAGVTADELLWSGWMRVPQFYQDPLYPYLIAACYTFARADTRVVLGLQLLAGVFTNLLIWSLARRFFGDAVAACAAALAVLCGPLMFYEILLLRDSLIAFAGLAVIWLFERARDRGWAWSGALGVGLGLACLLKSTFALLTVPLAVVMAARGRCGGRADVIRGLAAAAGLAIALAPVMVRNVMVGVRPLALATSGPLTFVAANEVRARPDVGFGIDAPVLAAFLGGTDGTWRAAIAAALESHTAGSYTALLWRKWDRLWHWFEIPNNEDFYYLRQYAPVLAWLPVTFWLCSPLAIVGLVLAARQWRRAWPLYALAGAAAAPLVLFYVLGRFRIAFAAAVIPFAALTLVEIGRALRRGRLVRGAAIAAAVLCVSAWTGRPLSSDQLLVRTSDWLVPWSVTYESEVYGALDAKNPAAAGAAYLEFFQYEPTEAQILASGDPRLAPEFADMHQECAQILRLAGQPSLADQQLQRANRLVGLRSLH